jgi:hypothetical protein
VWPLAAALALVACSKPGEIASASITAPGGPPAAARLSWPPPDVTRRLSDGEGEIVVAGAIAAHEMRHP